MEYLGKRIYSFYTQYSFQLPRGKLVYKISDFQRVLYLNSKAIYREDLTKEECEWVEQTLKKSYERQIKKETKAKSSSSSA